jgi:hypothetical protein
VPLTSLAAAIERAPADGRVEAKVRGRFTNILKGLDEGHLRYSAAKLRMKRMSEAFADWPADTRDAVLAASDEACDGFDERDHYERPQPRSGDRCRFTRHRTLSHQRESGCADRALLTEFDGRSASPLIQTTRETDQWATGVFGRLGRSRAKPTSTNGRVKTVSVQAT